MDRLTPSAVLALCLAAMPVLAGQEKAKAGPVEEQFLALRKNYLTAIKGLAGNDDKKHKIAAAFAPRFFALAVRNAKDEAAPDALLWILINAPRSPELPRAVSLLEKHYLQSPRLKPKLLPLGSCDSPHVEHFLRAVLARNKDKDTLGLACFALAQVLRETAGDNQKLRKEAMALLDLCVTKYAGCPIGKDATVGGRARPVLFEMRNLAIGKVVPDIIGEDLAGKKLKLSDYRGKVVMLSFWATWCPHCMALVPHERALVQRLKGKPFVLIGVNGDPIGDKKKVELRIKKEQIIWRSFWGGGIADKWNVEYWPAIFIIDHNGVIRHRFGVASAADYDRAINPLVAVVTKAPGKKTVPK